MNKADVIFWSVLGIIALFMIFKGNDIHRDYYKHIAEKAQHHAGKTQAPAQEAE